jgi:hypothetical protein
LTKKLIISGKICAASDNEQFDERRNILSKYETSERLIKNNLSDVPEVQSFFVILRCSIKGWWL